MPSISVIIPIYNASGYLQKCLDSIIHQTLTDFECLLIDDGSTDNSLEICKKYENLDQRFRVYHQENGGVSSARNLGLENACGEWIAFIDSDDWVDNNYLFNLFSNIKESELVISYAVLYFADGSSEKEHYPHHIITDENFYILFEDNALSWHTSPWSKLYKKTVIDDNNLRFERNVHIGEDAIFLYTYCLHIHSISVIDATDYCYQVQTSCSLTKRINSLESESLGLSKLTSIIKGLREHKTLSDKANKELDWLISSYINRVLTSLYYNNVSKTDRLKTIVSLDLALYTKNIHQESLIGRIYIYLLQNNMYHIYDYLRKLIRLFHK